MNLNLRPRLAAQLRNLSWRKVVAGLFTLAVFGYLFWTLAANWQDLRQYEWQVKPVSLIASLIAYLVSLWLGATAWHRIVWSMDQRVPYRTGVKFFLQSNLAKRIPGLIWYALGRLYLYEREGVAKAAVSVALTFELIALIIGGILAYLATAWSGPQSIEALQQWWLVFPLAILVFIMVWPKSLFGAVNWALVRRGHQALRSGVRRTDLLLWSLILAGGWLTGGLFIFALAAGVYPDVSWSLAVPVINAWVGSGLVAMMALIVPVGLGLKEVTLAYLLSAFMPWPVAVLISLLGRICSIIGDCVGLLVASRL